MIRTDDALIRPLQDVLRVIDLFAQAALPLSELLPQLIQFGLPVSRHEPRICTSQSDVNRPVLRSL